MLIHALPSLRHLPLYDFQHRHSRHFLIVNNRTKLLVEEHYLTHISFFSAENIRDPYIIQLLRIFVEFNGANLFLVLYALKIIQFYYLYKIKYEVDGHAYKMLAITLWVNNVTYMITYFYGKIRLDIHHFNLVSLTEIFLFLFVSAASYIFISMEKTNETVLT